MLIDIPENLELVVADENGVRTLRKGDELDNDKITTGAVRIMGMRVRHTTINRVQPSNNNQIQYGALMFNIGVGLEVYKYTGALGIMGYGFLWMIVTLIAKNVRSEIDLSTSSAASSSGTRARTADDSNPSSTE